MRKFVFELWKISKKYVLFIRYKNKEFRHKLLTAKNLNAILMLHKAPGKKLMLESEGKQNEKAP